MRVDGKRWGEITIKKQGNGKNVFDCTRSFSILSSRNHYDISQLKEIYMIATNLTEKYSFEDLKKLLIGLNGNDNDVLDKRGTSGQTQTPDTPVQ